MVKEVELVCPFKKYRGRYLKCLMVECRSWDVHRDRCKYIQDAYA